MSVITRTGLGVAIALSLWLPSAPARAQSDAGAWQDRPAPRTARRNDAYRPNGSESSGLGTLNDREPVERYPATDPGAYAAAPAYQPQYGGPRYGAPPRESYGAGTYPPPAPQYGGPSDTYRGPSDAYRGPSDGYRGPAPGPYASSNPGFGQPYTPSDDAYEGRGGRPFMSGDQGYRDQRVERRDGSFSADEITRAGHGFFGSISQGLASVIEHTFRSKGRPNGYILGEEGGGAWIAGLRYGQGTLYTKDAGSFPVYWQGPSVGFDVGAAGSKTMILVYNLRDPGEIYERFGGVDGSAYVVGGVGVTFLTREHITMAPIRSGIGLRLGANIGYLKFRSRPTWNPF